MRPHCPNRVAAGLAINPPRQEAWLLPWPDDPYLISPICDEHAEALTVPAGWLLHDERDGASALFAERSVAATEPATVTRLDHRRARREVEAEELTLFDTSPADSASDDVDRADDTVEPVTTDQHNAGAEWIGEPDERHTELLDVDDKTPLLARAFRASQAS